MVTPIIVTIKNIMDKNDKIGNASKYISNTIQYQVSGENTNSSRSETISTNDESAGISESTATTTNNLNRKF